jgi:drug/metabolite transporter (DMT)-like permease
MGDPTISPAEARAALASAEQARRKLAAAADCPPWRHAAFGAVMALLVLGPAFPGRFQAVSLLTALLAIAGIAAWDRKTYGVYLNGFRRGATLPLTIALVAVVLLLLLAQLALATTRVTTWEPFAVAGAAFAVSVAASVSWTRIFRREMERGA